MSTVEQPQGVVNENSSLGATQRSAPPAAGDAGTTAIVVRGVAWTGALRMVSQTASWASTLLLARLLAPADYGIVSMAATWAFFLTLIIEAGLGAVIVSRALRSRQLLRQLNSLAVILGIGGGVVALVAAPIATRFYARPELLRVLLTLAVLPLLDALKVVPLADLLRQQRYKEAATNDLGRGLAQTTVVLVLATLHFGYWALIFSIIASSVSSSVLAIWRNPIGFATPRGQRVRAILRTAAHLCFGRISWYVYSNGSFAIGGRVAGAGPLGYYSLAYNIAALPGEKLGTVVLAVTGPLFGRLRSEVHEARRWLLALTESLTLVIMVPLVGLVTVADLVVPLALGEKWRPAVAPLRWLVVYHALNTPVNVLSQALAARGDPRVSSRIGWISVSVLMPAFYVGAKVAGVTGVAAAWALCYPALTWLRATYVLDALETTWRDYANAWLPAIRISTIMTVAVEITRLAARRHVSPVGELMAAMTVGVITALLLVVRSESLVVLSVKQRVQAWRARRAALAV